MSRPKILLAAAIGLLAVALLAAPTAHAIELEPPDAHSPNAETIRSAYWVMFVIVIAVIVVVNAALIAAVVRFRARRGTEPAKVTAARGALRAPLAALSVLALVVFVYGVVRSTDARSVEPSGSQGLGGSQSAQVGIKDVPPSSLVAAGSTSGSTQGDQDPALQSPLVINAIAQEWLWRYEYPGHEPSQPLFAYSELVVPVDTAVILNVTSTDVLHSWWVPSLGGQVQATPGTVAQTWFKADTVGRYPGNSTIFSGSAYPAMRSWVRVVTVPEYQDYIEQLGSEITEAQAIVQQAQEEQITPTEQGSSAAEGDSG